MGQVTVNIDDNTPLISEILDTDYGPMIVPHHDINQTGALRKTRKGVHHDRMMLLAGIIASRPDGRVFVDAGANLGAFTMGLAPHVDGWIHAFEPQPIICNMLAGTVALSQRTNIRVHNVCLGDRDYRIEVPQFIYSSSLNFGSIEFGPEQIENLNQNRTKDAERVEFVPMRPLDWYGFQRIDVLKIDVQRMEIPLLAGAAETLERCRPVIFIEWIDNDPGTLIRTLASYGYVVKSDHQDDWLCMYEG